VGFEYMDNETNKKMEKKLQFENFLKKVQFKISKTPTKSTSVGIHPESISRTLKTYQLFN
jgi:hypothetical protein